MKTIKTTLLVSVIVLLGACTKDAPISNKQNKGQEISFVAEAPTRTQFGYAEGATTLSISWTASQDRVGMYGMAGGTTIASNLPYSAAATASKTAFIADGTYLMWADSTTAHNFYAYYPYSSTAGNDVTAVALTVPSVQTQSAADNTAHLAWTDFLYASKTGVTEQSSPSVELHFAHATSLLQLTLSAAAGTIETSRIIFRCTDDTEIVSAEGAKINLTTGAIDYTGATTSNQIVLNLTTPLSLTTSSTDKVYMQITPGHARKDSKLLQWLVVLRLS